VPTKLRLEVDGKPARELTLPATTDVAQENGTVAAPVRFAPVTGTTFRLVVTDVRQETTKDYFGGQPLALPIGIAEVGAPALAVPPLAPTAALPSTCRTDLLTVDGKPVPVRATGTVRNAEQRDGLPLQLCGPPPQLGAGNHDLRSVRGSTTGVDIDRLVLASAAGGGAGQAADPFAGPARTAGTPTVQVQGDGPVSYRLHVTGATAGQPFWLVLGQSRSPGWTAKAAGLGDLGEPQLVDGYANGWLITPDKAGDLDVALSWTPQRKVWIGLAVSAVALLVVLALAFAPRNRRARARLQDLVLDPEPLLASPLDGGTRAGVGATLGAALTAGVLTAVLVRPWAGLLVAVLTVLAGFVPRTRVVLRAGAVLGLVIAALYVLEVQARFHLPENGGWVAAFSKVATVSWLSVSFLVADTLLDWVQRRRDGRGRHAAGPAGPEQPDRPAEPSPLTGSTAG
jgi:hypothetical protein